MLLLFMETKSSSQHACFCVGVLRRTGFDSGNRRVKHPKVLYFADLIAHRRAAVEISAQQDSSVATINKVSIAVLVNVNVFLQKMQYKILV